mmetsp:Transcript_4986/g.18072  ORF Transcript_4986/g.18072 Transcript_4986/m.18072 type:complete len:318 (+) Transcript_4986:601-1554(+)
MSSRRAPSDSNSWTILRWMSCKAASVSKPLATHDWLVTTTTLTSASLSRLMALALPSSRRKSSRRTTPGEPTSTLITPSLSNSASLNCCGRPTSDERRGPCTPRKKAFRRASTSPGSSSSSSTPRRTHAQACSCNVPLLTTTARPSGAKLRPRSNSGCWYMSLTRPPASSTHTTAEAWSHTLRAGTPGTGCCTKREAPPKATAAYLHRDPQQRRKPEQATSSLLLVDAVTAACIWSARIIGSSSSVSWSEIQIDVADACSKSALSTCALLQSSTSRGVQKAPCCLAAVSRTPGASSRVSSSTPSLCKLGMPMTPISG